MCGQPTTKLPVLGIPNGTNLEIILEAIDTFLGASVAYNYNSYNLSYLRSKYTITNNQQFAEAVDVELQSIIVNFNASINALNSRLLPLEATQTLINTPNFTDPCNIGLTGSDTIFTSVQKLINYSCTKCIEEEEESTELVINETATIQPIQADPAGHTVSLNVKRSAQSPNALVTNADGLYVAPMVAPNQIQTLNYNGLTGALSISSGNTVVIPLQVPQVLGYDCATNMLSLSNGGGTQDLTCLLSKFNFTESTITFVPSNTLVLTPSAPNGHTLGGYVKIAPGANALQETASGLVVQPVTSENALTPTAGFVRWGGPLMQNTLVDGSAYDVGFSPRKFLVGNNITSAFGSTDPILNTRYMQVWTAYNHSINGAHALQSILDYTINSNIAGSSGLYTASGMAFTRYNLNATASIGLGFGLHGIGSMMRIKNTNPAANINMVQPSAGDGIRAMGVYNGSVIIESGAATNAGTVSHVAVFYSNGFIQETAGTDYTNVTNAYGLILNPILATGDASKFTNTFGVVQIGTTDDNSFEADVTATILPPSDERIKSNIRNFTGALDILNCIDIKRFDIRRGKRTEPDIGIIAQQLKTVLPEAVKQKIYLGYDDFNTIDIMKLLSVAIRAIQELSCKVDSLHITSSPHPSH